MVDYKPLTDEEVKKMADDIYKGLVFTDRQIQNPTDTPSVFMPLVFLTKELAEEFKDNPPGMIYEYMENAGHMSINGMPMFFSFRYISQEDAKKVSEKYNKIKEAIEKA